MAPNIVFAPNIRRTQNTDTGSKTQTQLITGFNSYCSLTDVNATDILDMIVRNEISILISKLRRIFFNYKLQYMYIYIALQIFLENVHCYIDDFYVV